MGQSASTSSSSDLNKQQPNNASFATQAPQSQYTDPVDDFDDDSRYRPVVFEDENASAGGLDNGDDPSIYNEFNPCPDLQKEAYRCLERIELYRLDHKLPLGSAKYQELRYECAQQFADYRGKEQTAVALLFPHSVLS